MKSLSIVVLVFIIVTFVPNTFAQVLSQKHLPEGAIARIGKGNASDVKYSPDGALIAVASQIGIWIYDAQTYQEIDLLTEHSESVEGVAFSPDGQTLAGANRGGTVKLWDVDTKQLKATFKGSGKWLMSVTFSAGGQTLACADGDELKLWDVKTERLKATLKGHTNLIWSVAFSPDGRTLASGSRDKTVRLWDVDTKRLKHTLTDHKTEVRSVAYSPDGRTLAGGSWYGGGHSEDNSICLWDAHTGRLKHTIPGDSSGVVFSPDGRTLGSMGWGGVKLLDANTGQLKATLRGIYDFGGGIAFSPDGQILAGANYSMVKLWDVNTGKHKTDLTGHAGISPNIAFSPDGQTLASTDYTRVRLWDANTGKHKTNFTGPGTIQHIAFSADRQTLASVSGSMIALWDVNTGQQKTQLIGHTNSISSIAFSRDGQTLATGSSTEVRLWDVSTGQQKTILQDRALRGFLIAYSPDGRTIATRNAYGPEILLWNTVTGEPLKVLTGHENRARAMAFSRDGRTLVSGSKGELLLWDVVEGQQSSSLPATAPCNASGLTLSPDGSILVTEWKGVELAVWDITVGKQLTTFSGHGNQFQHQITSLAFNPLNGNRVASASVDGTVLLWDLTSFIPQQTPTDAAIQRYEQEMVRLIYFRPSDRPRREDIFTELDTVIKWTQYFYAEQMQTHGDRKTFAFETDDTGYARVHHVTGKFTDTYYHQDTYDKVVQEVSEQFDTSTNAYLIAVDVSSEFINHEGTCGMGGGGWISSDNELWRRNFGGVAVIPASGICVNPSVTAHELGHVFGLEHDFRDDAYLMAYGTQERLSPCAAEWLDAHRFFNPDPTFFNAATTLEMRVQHAAEPGTSHLQFELTDADGLHQAQLLVPAAPTDPAPGLKLHSCKSLDGDHQSVTFTMTDPAVTSDSEVTLQVIDARGNITKQMFRVEIEPVRVAGDVNEDGIVNLEDMDAAADRLGQTGENTADVNNNGVVDVEDLLLIAAAIEQANAAPSLHSETLANLFTAAEVRQWLQLARQQGLTGAIYGRGFMVLSQLLAVLTPTETAVLPNYPNPFNPETWIPYQLSSSADVTVHIYAINGSLARTLALGHQAAGIYQSRGRAVYWDGKNELGEPVASGVYFYTLTAGDFTATRKLLIRK